MCFITSPSSVFVDTLCRYKHSLTPPGDWIQVFQSLPRPQVYKAQRIGMQTAARNICERMSRFQRLSGFLCAVVIGILSVQWVQIFSVLNIPQSTVGGITTKWEWLGMTSAHKAECHSKPLSEGSSRSFFSGNRYRPPSFLQHPK